MWINAAQNPQGFPLLSVVIPLAVTSPHLWEREHPQAWTLLGTVWYFRRLQVGTSLLRACTCGTSLHMWYSNCLLKSASNYYLRLESVPLPFSLVYLLRYPLSASWNSSFITYANTASSIDRLADVLFAIVIFSHKPPDFNCRLGVFDLYLTGSA